MYFLDFILPNEFNPLYHYLALIATEVARTTSKNPKKIEIQHKLLKFVVVRNKGSKDTQSKELTEEERKQMLIQSKQKWFAFAGLSPKGEVKTVEKKRKPLTRRVPGRKNRHANSKTKSPDANARSSSERHPME